MSRSMSSASWNNSLTRTTMSSSELAYLSSPSIINTPRSSELNHGSMKGMSDVFMCCLCLGSDDQANQKEKKKLLKKKWSLQVISGSVTFTWDEILKATNYFSNSMIIGEGGCSVVYKGTLDSGKEVAIKRARKDVGDEKFYQESFRTEIETLQQINHNNLVGFYGYLVFDDEKIIVDECVPNGNLREHLDCKYGKVLEFANRLDIIIDVAHAINYLHTYCDTPLIHRDIKSSNILLTNALHGKVADFGLAKLASTDANNTYVRTAAKGTPGYIDPDYFRTNQLTSKSDVFSFGVVLVETLTGKRPIEKTSKVTTVKWALTEFQKGDAASTLDPKLIANDAIAIAVKEIYELASRCVHDSRKRRPTMEECCRILWNIRKKYNDMTKESIDK